MEWLRILTEWLDDKSQVIASLLIIAILCIFFQIGDNAAPIISNIISGLLGVAIGRALPRTNGNGNPPQ